MANPKPVRTKAVEDQKWEPLDGRKESLAEKPLTFRVSVESDRLIRAMPDRSAWLRSVVESAARQLADQQEHQ